MSKCRVRNTQLAVGARPMWRLGRVAQRPNSGASECSNTQSMVISSASRSSTGIDIHNNTIPSVTYSELGIRYAFRRDPALEIFGNVNNPFEQGLRAAVRTLRRAGICEFNDGVYAVLGRSAVVGVRPSLR